MKTYGLKDLKDGYIYYADQGFEKTCKDEDAKFGTDDLNEAYQFADRYKPTKLIVFEKIVKDPNEF